MSEFDPQQQTEISRLIDSGTASGDLSVLTRQVQGASAKNMSDLASVTTRVTNLEALVPHVPMQNWTTGATGIYGPFTADFTSGIAPATTVTYSLNISSYIGTKTPIVVFGAPRNGSGSGMAQVSWRADVSSGAVTIAAYNVSTTGTQFGTIVFCVIA